MAKGKIHTGNRLAIIKLCGCATHHLYERPLRCPEPAQFGNPGRHQKAFRQAASTHHPDRNPAPEAAARFRAAQAAYEVLSDPVKRKAFDDNRQRNLLDDPLHTAHEIWQTYVSRIV